MSIYFRCYNILNHLSLDVALGAVASSWFLSRIFNVHAPLVIYLVLGVSVWCIYTFDHLLDAKKKKGALSLQRHLFHRKYYSVLSKILILALTAVGVLIFFLPFDTLALGGFLGCMVLVYFISIHLLNWEFVVHKEHAVAVIYTLGIIVGPFSLLEGSINLFQILILITFFLVVLLNVLIFSFYDSEADMRAGYPSIVQAIGIRHAQRLIKIISIVAVGFILVVFWMGFHHEFIIFFLMFAVLQILFFFNNRQVVRNNYRFLGDGIFLIPLIYLL